jgi:hypothetical protein
VADYVVRPKHIAAAVARFLVLSRSEAVAASIKPAIDKHLRHLFAPVPENFNQSLNQVFNTISWWHESFNTSG